MNPASAVPEARRGTRRPSSAGSTCAIITKRSRCRPRSSATSPARTGWRTQSQVGLPPLSRSAGSAAAGGRPPGLPAAPARRAGRAAPAARAPGRGRRSSAGRRPAGWSRTAAPGSSRSTAGGRPFPAAPARKSVSRDRDLTAARIRPRGRTAAGGSSRVHGLSIGRSTYGVAHVDTGRLRSIAMIAIFDIGRAPAGLPSAPSPTGSARCPALVLSGVYPAIG